MKSRRIFVKSIILMAAALSLSACQATPKEEVIKQKGNLEEVINDNQVTDTPRTGAQKNLRDTLEAPEKDKLDFKTGNGNVEISVDAEVFVPEVTKVPVIHLNRKDLTDEDIKPFCDIFFGDNEIFPERTYKDYTKDELLQTIADAQKRLDKVEPEYKDQYELKLKPFIEELQDLLETAPETVTIEPVREYKFSELDSFGSRSFMVNGNINGNTGHLIVQKGSSFNNCSFSLDKPEGYLCYSKSDIIGYDGAAAADMPNNCKISEADAVKMAGDIVARLGRDKEYFLYSVEPLASDLPSNGATSYGGYRVKFSRNVEGIPETVDMYMFDDELGCLDTFPYPYERMEFTISDLGIENFYWDSPMDIGDTQAENVNLLPYQDIMDIFKNQILLKYADEETASKVHIVQIRFGLMRVKDKDDPNSFTMLPAWDFLSNDSGLMSILTINAIDGSILNRSLGY